MPPDWAVARTTARSTARTTARSALRAARGTARRGRDAGRQVVRTRGQVRLAAEAARLVAASGLVDREWLGIQLRETYATDAEAVAAFLETSAYVSPHPLVEVDWLDPGHGFVDRGLNSLQWVLTEMRGRSTHPLLDLAELRAQVPDADEHPGGPLGAYLAVARPDTLLPVPPGTPPVSHGDFLSAAYAAARTHATDTVRLGVRRIFPDPPPEVTALPQVVHEGAEPLVSIVLPTWNRARLLRRAVESVQAQSWASWELLIVDDGSDDDTLAVAEGLARFDDRVVVVPAEHGGVCRARNEGIDRARGRYVAFLDSDNTWRPHYLRMMVAALEAHGWEMAHAVLGLVRDGQSFYRAHEGDREDLLVRNHVDLNVLMVRRDLLTEIGGFDTSLRRAVDYDLVLRLAERAPLHLVPYVGTDYTEDETDPHRISVQHPVDWNSVVLGRHLLDWAEMERRTRVPGRVGVVLPTRGGLRRSVQWITDVAAARAAGADVELVLAGARIRRSHHVIAATLATLYGGTTVQFIGADVNLPLAADLGVAVTTGEHLVLVRGDATLAISDAVRLTAALADPAVDLVQPLLIDTKGAVVAAGAVFGDLLRPQALLAGHAPSDAAGLAGVDLPACMGPVVACRAASFIAARGFDPLYAASLVEVDLSLRMTGVCRVDPAVRALSLVSDLVADSRYPPGVKVLADRWPGPPPGSRAAWAAAGFEVVGHRNRSIGRRDAKPPGPHDQVDLVPEAVVRPVSAGRRLESVVEAAPRLRWTIDLASPPGLKGEAWGDTHFARSLAEALGRLDQTVAVDSRALRHRSSRDLDDVLLVLRGLDPVEPRPGLLNVEWVISHPDLVTRQEAAGFDLVYAASMSWAAKRTAEWGVRVQPLLQCTDPALFHPGLAGPDTGPEVLFVGNSRGVYRAAVRSALAAGVDLTLYGQGWGDFVPAGRVAGVYVDNRELGVLYASAGVVLNDHWEDMRRDGFLSNRLFDAAACGTRVVSDEVAGLDGVLGDLVRTFHADPDLARLLADPAAAFPDAARRQELAAAVVRDHSFDARAAVLLHDAAHGLALRRHVAG